LGFPTSFGIEPYEEDIVKLEIGVDDLLSTSMWESGVEIYFLASSSQETENLANRET